VVVLEKDAEGGSSVRSVCFFEQSKNIQIFWVGIVLSEKLCHFMLLSFEVGFRVVNSPPFTVKIYLQLFRRLWAEKEKILFFSLLPYFGLFVGEFHFPKKTPCQTATAIFNEDDH
jgi:hypothetical protein